MGAVHLIGAKTQRNALTLIRFRVRALTILIAILESAKLHHY